VEIYRCLVGAGLLDEAVRFWRGNLSNTLYHHLGANTLIVELLLPLFDGKGRPRLASAEARAYVLNDLAISVYQLGRYDEALRLHLDSLRIVLDERNWQDAGTSMRNIAIVASQLNRRAEAVAALALALDLAEAAANEYGVRRALVQIACDAIEQGRFTDGQRLLSLLHTENATLNSSNVPGEVEYLACLSQFFMETLTESDWRRSYELAHRHRNVLTQHRFFALRAEWLLTQSQPAPALDAMDEAIKIVNRLGSPSCGYHDLRAWALARLGRAADARTELANGEQRRYAAEAWLILGDREQARTCALNCYRWAWGEGSPYIMWYDLERGRTLLRELGEPEPQLPPFDPSKVKPIPYEAEIRAAIATLKAEKEAQAE
jgi:tetratricopeptide (TPR) repeat protein